MAWYFPVKEISAEGIIAFHVFILTWVPILISCFFRRSVEWTPIKHDQKVSIDDIKKTE